MDGLVGYFWEIFYFYRIYCHLNVLGIESWDPKKVQGNTTEEKIRSTCKIAHEMGGVVTINHYPWSTGGEKPRIDPKIHPTREQALEWGVDFIEASNWDDDINTIDMLSYNFCKNHDGIAPVAGTDVHAPEKDSLWAWTLVNVPNSLKVFLCSIYVSWLKTIFYYFLLFA